MTTDLRHLSPRTLWGLAVAVGAMLSLLFIAHVSQAGPEETKAATLQQRLESGTVLREFDTEGAYVRQFKLAKDCVAFLLRETDSSVAVVYSLNGATRFRRAAWNGNEKESIYAGLGDLKLSDDGSTLILSEVTGYEDGKSEFYDISSGKLLFELEDEASLIPSPHGQYFCKLYDGVNYEALAIFDRRGERVKSFETTNEWNCLFLDDDRLVVVDSDTLRIIATRNGDILKIAALNSSSDHRSGYPRYLALSCDHHVIVAYDPYSLLVFDGEGKELWRATPRDRLCALAIDDTDRLMVQQLGYGQMYGYLAVVPLDTKSVGIESIKMPAMASCAAVYNYPPIWFVRGLIAVWQPFGVFPDHLENTELSTVLLELDDRGQSLSPPVTRPGLYCPVESAGGETRFIRADKRGNAVLISIPSGSTLHKERR